MPDIFDEISLEETPSGDIFDQIEASIPPTISQEIGRHGARTGSRIAETILGLPSDILQTAQLGARGLKKGAAKIREKIGLKPLEIKEKPRGVPGSREIREFSEKIFGEKVTPKTKTESFIDDIVSDAAALALPVKGKIPFIRAIGTALSANVASEVAEKLGATEKQKIGAKIGTFFLAGLSGKGNVRKYWNKQYKLAEKSIPKGAEVEVFKMDAMLDRLEDNLRKGVSTPSKKFVLSPLKKIQNKIVTGEIPVEELLQFKRDINELRGSLYKDLSGKPSIKYAQGKINDLSKIIDNEISAYGKTNPEFMKHYRNANEAYAGFHQSKRVGNWVNRALPFGKMGKTALFIAESIFKPASLKFTLPGVAAFKSAEFITRMLKNSTLRRYYTNLMKSAVDENKTGVIRNLRNMEKEIEKNEPDMFELISKSTSTHNHGNKNSN